MVSMNVRTHICTHVLAYVYTHSLVCALVGVAAVFLIVEIGMRGGREIGVPRGRRVHAGSG